MKSLPIHNSSDELNGPSVATFENYDAAHRTSDALRQYEAGLLIHPTNLEAQAAVKRLQSQTPAAKP